MQIDELEKLKKWECCTLCAIKMKALITGGGKEETCDHGWSRKSLRVRPFES